MMMEDTSLVSRPQLNCILNMRSEPSTLECCPFVCMAETSVWNKRKF